MRLIIVPIFIFLIGTQTFSKWVMLLNYQLNKEYVANNLCENKARPKLKCEGKCQLAKKMVEEEKESSSQAPNLKLKFQETVFANEAAAEQTSFPAPRSSKLFTDYLLKAYTAPVPPVFHPPA